MCRPEVEPWTETWAEVYGRWIGHPLCPVELRPSCIPGAGDGVFARRAIPAGAFVTPFDGRLVPGHRHVTSKTWDYEYQMAHGAHMVPALTARSGRGLGHLLNDAIHPDVTGFVNNCEFHEQGRAKLWIRSRCAVAAGEELFVPYGWHYWCGRENAETLTPKVRDWCSRQCAIERLLMLLPTCATVEEYMGSDDTGSTYRIRRHAAGGDVPTCTCFRAFSAYVHVDTSGSHVRCMLCSAPILHAHIDVPATATCIVTDAGTGATMN